MKLKTLQHVSASQISTYMRCPRKHWLEKIEGVEVPTSPGAAFGTRGHAAVETRIQTGAWPDDPEVVPIAMAGWRFIPQDQILLVEKEMHLEDAALPIIGRIDLIAPESSVIIDHKFMSSLRYVKTPAQLAEDPQAILYCTWGLRAGYFRKDSVAFRHIVYQTKGTPQATTSQVKFALEQLEYAYSNTKTTIERMAEHAAMQEAGAVPAAIDSDDTSPCRAYGGCPHLSRCTSESQKSVFSLISATGAKEKEVEKLNVFEALAKKKKAQGIVDRVEVDAGAINPPESVDPPAQADAAPTPTLTKRKIGVVSAVNDAIVQSALSFPPSDEEMKGVQPVVQDGPTSKIVDPFALSTIYVGCLPVNENFILLDNWLAPLQAEAAQTLGVDYYAQAEYGKGKTALAALVIHKVKVDGIPPVLVVDPRLPASETMLEILRPMYKRIVMRIG